MILMNLIKIELHKISVGIYSNFSYFGHWFLQRYCIVKQRKNKTCFREEKFDKIEFKEQDKAVVMLSMK